MRANSDHKPPSIDLGFPAGSAVKNLPAMQETQVRSLGQEDPLEKEMAPTPVLLPGKSHEQMSLVGYSPWGCKRDGIERLKNNNNQTIYWSVSLSSLFPSIFYLPILSFYHLSVHPSICLICLPSIFLFFLPTIHPPSCFCFSGEP